MCEICQGQHDTLDCPDYPLSPSELFERDENAPVWHYVAQSQGTAYRQQGVVYSQAQCDERLDNRQGGHVYHQRQLAYSRWRGWYLPPA